MSAVHRVLLALSLFAAPLAAQSTVRLDVEQARLALAYLRATSPSARDSVWRLHVATPGYVRLHEREAEMNRAFTDSSFRAFLDSDTLRVRTEELSRTFEAWRRVDFASAEQRARKYLPAGTVIRATVFIMIKPRTNSFVFDASRNPAIFLYLDPTTSAPKFANTAAHELHHIGLNAACPDRKADDPRQKAVDRWLPAFGEGWAMLAAAGSATTDPHAASSEREQAEWRRNLLMAQEDMRRLEHFFLAARTGAIPLDSVDAKGFEFFNERPQGPWYTVGWLMTSTVERTDGRTALLKLICDPMGLIRRYQAIATKTGGPRWSESFVKPN
jgi:hypothetical protein